MTTQPRFAWEDKWTVDVSTATATHETGLCVRFYLTIKDVSQDNEGEICSVIQYDWKDDEDVYLGSSQASDGTEWAAVTTVKSRDEIFDKLVVKNGPHNTPRMIIGLGKQAGKVWIRAWSDHKQIPVAKQRRSLDDVIDDFNK